MSKRFSLLNVSCPFLNTVEPSTNGHLSTTATFFAPADSQYINSCLNLSTYGKGH